MAIFFFFFSFTFVGYFSRFIFNLLYNCNDHHTRYTRSGIGIECNVEIKKYKKRRRRRSKKSIFSFRFLHLHAIPKWTKKKRIWILHLNWALSCSGTLMHSQNSTKANRTKIPLWSRKNMLFLLLLFRLLLLLPYDNMIFVVFSVVFPYLFYSKTCYCRCNTTAIF